VTAITLGPVWTEPARRGRYAGRYPLSVERHVLQQVSRLAPGVTTVTPNARYFLLHTLVAIEAQERGMLPAEHLELLRRAEVVLCAVSSRHMNPHPGWSSAHGAGVVLSRMTDDGVAVAELAAPEVYSQSKAGFRGQYVASELSLGLLQLSKGELVPGPTADSVAIRASLGPIIGLARQEHVSLAELDAARSLCLCGSINGPDGALLRRLLLARDAAPDSVADHRKQTVRMLARLIELHSPAALTRDLTPRLAFGDLASTDPVLVSLRATMPWRGTVLRSQSVTAWRGLWAWLVNDNLGSLITRDEFAAALADVMPGGTVRQFIAALPPEMVGGQPAPAEVDSDVTSRAGGLRQFSVLTLGALRSQSLPEPLKPEFEGGDEANQELTPTWLWEFLQDRMDRSTRDTAAELVGVLLDRSQRVALRKASYDRRLGVFKFPTRVFTRDQYVFRDSAEGGGAVGLRWEQLVTVLAGVGVFSRSEDRWHLSEAGSADLA
jgi:hypothetical protein